jgi:hypothetical protein
VTVGLIVLLALANLIGWVWFVQHQDDQFAMLQSQVSAVDVGSPPAVTDPDLCWLVGASAKAAGHGDAFVALANASGVMTDCNDAAIRGAQGYGR